VKRIQGRLKVAGPGSRDLTRSDYLLIVDSDAPFAMQLKTELATVGLEALRVADAEAAQQILVELSPQAIVVDLRLAGRAL
jgi:ActR/RegA family two-component response regulator